MINCDFNCLNCKYDICKYDLSKEIIITKNKLNSKNKKDFILVGGRKKFKGKFKPEYIQTPLPKLYIEDD